MAVLGGCVVFSPDVVESAMADIRLDRVDVSLVDVFM